GLGGGRGGLGHDLERRVPHGPGRTPCRAHRLAQHPTDYVMSAGGLISISISTVLYPAPGGTHASNAAHRRSRRCAPPRSPCGPPPALRRRVAPEAPADSDGVECPSSS